jgi:hypothetical protein
MVISDGQTRVIDALKQKTQKADQLYTNLTTAVNTTWNERGKEFSQKTLKPKF